MNKTKNEILEEKLKEFGLNSESKLYRYTSKKYVLNEGDSKYLKAKDECLDLVEDHYDDIGHTFISKEFGKGLSFLIQPESEYEQTDRKLASIKLSDVLDQEGFVYRITSLPEYLEGYFVTLPTGKVKILFN